MSIAFQPFITSEYIQPHAEVLGESGKTLPQWAGLDSLLFEMDRNLDHYSLEPVLAQAVEERMKD